MAKVKCTVMDTMHEKGETYYRGDHIELDEDRFKSYAAYNTVTEGHLGKIKPAPAPEDRAVEAPTRRGRRGSR